MSLCVAVVMACGSSEITDPNGSVDAPIVSRADARPVSTALDARVTCTGASQCMVGQVCSPTTMTCVADFSCTTHTQCGAEAYCTPQGTCSINMLHGDCAGDANCVGGETCISGHCGCGGELLTATAVPPNMLIALDRSQSMSTNVPGTDPARTRWQVAISAIDNLTSTFEGNIRFGLVLWPGVSQSCTTANDHNCQGTRTSVDVDLDTGMSIGDALAAAGQCSHRTPIGNTLTALEGYPSFTDATRPNYVVLITDGEENCEGDGAAAATALRQHSPEVKTFAIGFGGEVNATNLAAIATAGGTARTGTPKYYQADDEATLETAFSSIAGTVIGCDYTLSSIPDDPNLLLVYLGQGQLLRDTSKLDGWDYNATSHHLTFYGATCTRVKSGSEGNLSISFGCPVIP